MNQWPKLPVILLSHRGPVTFGRDAGGRTVGRGASGLVNAVTPVVGSHLSSAVWICCAITDEDVAVARERRGRVFPVRLAPPSHPDHTAEAPHGERGLLNVRMVEVEPSRHREFYSVVANPLLWFMQHGLYGLARSPELTRREHVAFEHGYVAVNERLAEAVVEQVEAVGGHALVMLHDYHFYPIGRIVRERCPGAVLSHFVHIPWPAPDTWRLLPPSWRDTLLRGLLGNDVVAFHTEHFARNFLLCAQELLGLPVDFGSMTVHVDGRTVSARHYPISVDVAALDRAAASPPVAECVRELRGQLLGDGRQLVVRVDRTDPAKNIVRGFHAFATLLDQHPELVGRVTFLAVLAPGRQRIPDYADYLAAVQSEAAAINARYASPGYQPVDLRLRSDPALVVAAYKLCDVIMVNSLADGMNVVAKEAVVVAERDGVLALSETAGVHEQLGRFAVTLCPLDVQQQADALHEALTMHARQRARRRRAAAALVRRHDVGRWLTDQLDDLGRIHWQEVEPAR